ncbi:MAG: hypothetical protein OEX00_12215, partial [Gammaproteobacteria bacterium]|nr:hypothetical protein [Gammaproteobacteria bacterium]
VGHEPKNFSRVEGLFKYTLTGKHYLDSKHENANQSDQEFSFGGVFRMGEKSKLESGLKVDVFWHKRNKLYIDRDTGEKKLTGAMDDISGKYTYTSVGLEAELFKQLSNNAEFGLGFNTEALDFEKPITGREYDNRFTEFFVKTDYRPFKYTKLKIDLSQASENYSDRRSRDLDGSMFGSYPTRVYNFQEIGFQVRQRVIQNLVTYADYSINNRKDEYLGYSNRSKSTMAVRVLYKFNEKLDSKFKFSYSNYDYPNALAYDKLISDPSSPSRIPLTYSSSQISGKLEYALKKNIAVVGELSVYNADSSDKRYDYERNEVTVGVNSHW